MTHLSTRAAALTAACLMLASAADGVRAQCTTCATPTVAYSPVVAAAPVVAAPATVVVQRPGFFDRWRMRRWGVTAPVVVAPTYAAGYAPTYTAAYAPTYTAAYAPTYTAAYAPTAAYATPYTAGYTPYYSAYAPLQPATVYRPAVLTPVVASYAPACDTCTTCNYAAPACDSCATTASYAAAPACSSCSASTYVQPAGYAAPASGCACQGTAVSPSAVPAATSSGDPYTPVPALNSDVGTPVGSNYLPSEPTPEPEAGAFNEGLQAPQLMAPVNDHTASRPSVDVHTAVYRRPIPATGVSTATEPSRAVDSGEWDTVPASR